MTVALAALNHHLLTIATDPRPGDVVRLHRPGMEAGKIDTAIATVLRADGGFYPIVEIALAYIGGGVFERDLEIDDWRKLLRGVDIYGSPPHVATVIYLSDRADSAHRAMTGGEAT